MSDGGVEEQPLVREAPVEGPYADAGPFGDRIPRRLTANFQNRLDRGLDQPLPFLHISPHCIPRRLSCDERSETSINGEYSSDYANVKALGLARDLVAVPASVSPALRRALLWSPSSLAPANR